VLGEGRHLPLSCTCDAQEMRRDADGIILRTCYPVAGGLAPAGGKGVLRRGTGAVPMVSNGLG